MEPRKPQDSPDTDMEIVVTGRNIDARPTLQHPHHRPVQLAGVAAVNRPDAP
jgi:hypothetical protein